MLLLKMLCFFFIMSLPAMAAERSSVAELAANPALRSVEGRSFEILSIAAQPGPMPAKPRRLLLQAAMHGDEILTTTFVLWLSERLDKGQSPLNALGADVVFDLIPQVNPDRHGKDRYNARGINLNRNFGVHWGIAKEPAGDHSFSEPETQALKALFKARRYIAAVDMHGYLNWVVMPSQPSATEPTSQRYNAWSRAVQKQMQHLQPLGPYERQQAMGLGDGGAFEDWAFWEGGAFALCLEMTSPQRFIDGRSGRDSFLVYEAFLVGVFRAALDLSKQNPQS